VQCCSARFPLFCSILIPNISWTTSPGYPLVSVSNDPQSNNIVLSARAYTPALYSSARPVPVWWIPVNYTISTAATPAPVTVKTSFMSDTQVAAIANSSYSYAVACSFIMQLVITLSGQVNWIQVNSDGYGAYRTV
jgi:aminopeptidase N